MLLRLWRHLFGADVKTGCDHCWHNEWIPHPTCSKPDEEKLVHQCCHCDLIKEWDF
jgi:hypothetical protein